MLTTEKVLETMRLAGWVVAVHNDYRLNGESHTFWLFTNQEMGRFAKGEGRSDLDALIQAANSASEAWECHSRADTLARRARGLINDVRQRYSLADGLEFDCYYMRFLEHALKNFEQETVKRDH